MDKSIKNKIILAIIVIVVMCITIVGVFMFKYEQNKNKPFNTTNKILDIQVQNGEYLYSVINKLEQQGVIKNAFLTKIYLKMNPSSTDIKPGSYEISSDTTISQFVQELSEGKVAAYTVTFPEGFTIEQMASRLQKDGVMNADVFLQAVKNYPLPSYIKPNSERRYNLEGFLYPDTYNIPKNATADDIISMMLNQFQKEVKLAEKNTGVTINENDYQKIVTIASMIEGEGNTQQNRENVSSVIYNRLQKGMKLQLDATVLYAMGQHQDKVYIKNTQIKSPYNTYYVEGLPVGAINNPGINCLEAALKPAKTDYIFYIINGNDEYFTNNYNDFLSAKKRLLPS